MSLLGLLLLSTLVLPQDAVPSRDYTIPQSELTSQLMNNFVLDQQHARRLDPIQVEKLESDDNTCFAIRTYIFKREDGNAPELAGTTNLHAEQSLPAEARRKLAGQAGTARLQSGELKSNLAFISVNLRQNVCFCFSR
jgi:hypothetical protein